MAPGAPVQVLRSGLLGGLDVVLAGHVDGLDGVLGGLGADVQRLAGEPLDEQAVGAAAAALERATVVVCASGGAMRAAADPAAGLRAAVEGAWIAARAIVREHLSAGGFGKVLLIAPRPGDGPDAAAAGAALENLARTAGVEWARLGIRVVTVRPRDVTTDAALAQCIAYLASPAGDYFSGCTLDLGAAGMTA
jgi:NAD(P)-dependent dehydrogenase (short-subunit alcohol dehydrogenase family)